VLKFKHHVNIDLQNTNYLNVTDLSFRNSSVIQLDSPVNEFTLNVVEDFISDASCLLDLQNA